MRHLHGLLCCLLIGAGLRAQSPRPMPIRRLAGGPVTAGQLTARLARLVDSARIAGLSVLLLQDGRPVYEQYFGVRDRRSGQPLTPETVSYAASLTKPVATYLFLRLVDQGVFALDTPAYRYLPRPVGAYEKWQELARDSAFRRITPRMLLSHSAGLPVLRGLYGPVLATIAPPGTRYFYSNEGFNLLGTLMEERTGQTLQQLAEQHIFGPLGMRRSSFVWQDAFAGNVAVAHDGRGTVLGYQQRRSARAAGSMVTTPRDYAAFLQQVQARRGLSRRLYRQMLAPQVVVGSRRGWGPLRDSLRQAPDPARLAWGLGWGLFESRYGRAFWHGGHADGWQNFSVSYPRRQTSLVLLSNSDNFERVAGQILRLCLGVEPPALEWSGYNDQPAAPGG